MKEGSVFLQILWFGLLKGFLSTHSTFSCQPIQRSTSRKKCFLSFLFPSLELWVFKQGNTPTLSLNNHTLFHGLYLLAKAVCCSHCMASLSVLMWPQGTYKPSSHHPSSSFYLETGWKVLPLSWVVLFLCSFQPFGLSYTIWGTLDNMHLSSNHSSLNVWRWWQCPFLPCWVCSRLSDPDCAEHPLCLMRPSSLIMMFSFLVTDVLSPFECVFPCTKSHVPDLAWAVAGGKEPDGITLIVYISQYSLKYPTFLLSTSFFLSKEFLAGV